QSRPTTAVHAILTGAQSAATPSKPTAASMPAFAWKLTDYEVASVATYVGNSWGNTADPVSEADVAKLRAHVAAHPVRRRKGAV
ncbi:c-type cytochrome, partial [Mycobacterium tuberculosis]